MFDLETGEQRNIVNVTLDAIDVVRHHGAHKGVRLFVHFVGIDQDFADFRIEVVADGANHERTFQINQGRRFFRLGRISNRRPQLIQVVQVPLQLFFVATDTGGASDDAHAFRYFQMRQYFAQFCAFVPFDTA